MKIKYSAIFLLLFLISCGAAQSPVDLPQSTVQYPAQPYSMVGVGDFINGMSLHIESLPDGNWVVSQKEGSIVLMDKDFKIFNHDSIPVETYLETGLYSIVADPNFFENHSVYALFTTSDDSPPCENNYCQHLVRYFLDEHGESPLQNPELIEVFPMIDRWGAHNGGGLAFGDDGFLYVAIGDGEDSPTATVKGSQDLASPLGKVFRVDTVTFDSQIAAMGFRNPFTMISVPGGVLVGDVGFDTYEEADFLPSGSGGIVNSGWPLEEGPGTNFSSPTFSLKHCDETYKDEDPFGHEESKALTIKNHNGVVHECGGEIITVAGFYPAGGPDPYNGKFDNHVIWSEPYDGYIRTFAIEGDGVSDHHHIAHDPGLVSIAKGPDGYLYGVSMFNSNYVLKLTSE